LLERQQRWHIGLLLTLLIACALVSLLRMILHPDWPLFFASVAVAWIVAAHLFRMIVDRP